MPQRAEHTDISYRIGKRDPFLLIQLLPTFYCLPDLCLYMGNNPSDLFLCAPLVFIFTVLK